MGVCVSACLKMFKQHSVSIKTHQTWDIFPQQWQLWCFDLCVFFTRPSASCCDIQTELRVISLGDLRLPHESCWSAAGGSPGGQPACIPAPGDVQRPETAAASSLVPPKQKAVIQPTYKWPGLALLEVRQSGGSLTTYMAHYSDW